MSSPQCRSHSNACTECKVVVDFYLEQLNIGFRKEEVKVSDYIAAARATNQHHDFPHFRQCGLSTCTLLSMVYAHASELPNRYITVQREATFEITDGPISHLATVMVNLLMNRGRCDKVKALMMYHFILEKTWGFTEANEILVGIKMMHEGGIQACLHYLDEILDCNCLQQDQFSNKISQEPQARCENCKLFFYRSDLTPCNKCR